MNLFDLLKRRKNIKPAYQQLSVTGLRDNNQDSCIVLELGEGNIFMAVADGMGGTAGGYLASNLAINIAYDELDSRVKEITEKNLKQIIMDIYSRIQKTIKEQIVKNPALEGMGITFSCILFHNNKYAWGNIGDSKIYKFRKKQLMQITEDHSYINNFKKENETVVSDGMMENYGHLLTKCLDGQIDLPDVFPLDKDYEEINKKEYFLLCSDGLLLPDSKSKLLKLLPGNLNLEKSVKDMVAYSLDAGSRDNITVILYSPE